MKTIIFDIDGTITDMWPIERAVLLNMTNNNLKYKLEKLKSAGVSDTYKLFCKISRRKINKSIYIKLYNKTFNILLGNKRLPKLKKYPIVKWIVDNKDCLKFVYATGGQKAETEYALEKLGIKKYFNLSRSLNKNNCRFAKCTGIPFRKIKCQTPDCILITDSESDCMGAMRAEISYIKIKN
jgi:beta-phosphoglucomutase-like phosphatase (HAD superfamily)